jgi:hypothetical protein
MAGEGIRSVKIVFEWCNLPGCLGWLVGTPIGKTSAIPTFSSQFRRSERDSLPFIIYTTSKNGDVIVGKYLLDASTNVGDQLDLQEGKYVVRRVRFIYKYSYW